MRARRRDRTKDQSNQGEDKGYVQYSAQQEATKADGDRVASLLCDVAELVSRKVWCLQKIDPTRAGILNQA